jgi:PadR family transcriptional regulator PadR
MEVCLLVLLRDGESHGYSLAERLAEFGFEADELNISTLYRTLRKMEEDGCVVSCWEQGGKGPKRRVYAITDIGRQELEDWVSILEIRKQRIEKLVERYRQAEGRDDKGNI